VKFERYPMVMRHPAEAPAIVSQWNEQLQRHVPEHGQAAKFQPVTVNDADQEAYHAAQGYVGSGDPQSFESAVSNPLPGNYQFQEYPKWVGQVLVHSKAEEDALGGTPEALDASTATAAPPKRQAPAKRSYRERTGAAAPASTADAGAPA